MRETPHGFFNIEQPAEGAALAAGSSLIRGWLVAKPAAHFVDVRARVGARIFPAVYGIPRADLAAHFEPTRPFLPAEFHVQIDLAPGPAEVVLEALDISGQWDPFHTAHYSASAGAPAPAGPAPIPVRAHEFGRALRVWLQQSRVAPGENADARADKIAAAIPFPRALRDAHAPFHGHLDEPAAITPGIFGRIRVLGWVFHETQAIRRIFVSADLVTFNDLAIGGEMGGLTARFPQFPHAADCRIFGLADVPASLPAPSCIRVYAELADGSVHLCLAVSSYVLASEEDKALYPPFSYRKFWRGWRSLTGAFEERGVPLELGALRRQEILKIFREYRTQAQPLGGAELATTAAKPAAAKLRRVLLITHDLGRGGAPLLFVEYARHLAATTGAKLTVLSMQDGPLHAIFESLGAEVRLIGSDLDIAVPTARQFEQGISRIARAMDWREVDLVVANTLASFWGVPLARAAGKPVLLYIHESTTPTIFYRFCQPPVPLAPVRAAFRDATAVSFNTPASLAYYSGLGSGKNYRLLPGWIDLRAIDEFRTHHDRATLRARLGLRPEDLVVVNIGNVCDRKGQHDFVRAAELLWRREPALAARGRFFMVGGNQTPYNQDVARLLPGQRCPHHVIVMETERAYDYFGAADVFFCSSYEESFPRVVMEAMAFALPIISTNVHGVPYMLRAGEEALLVAPGDIHAMAAALAQTLGDPASAAARGARARARVVAEFTTDLILPRHAALTLEVAATGR